MSIARGMSCFLIVFLLFGFRTFGDRRWGVSVEQPILWLELDEELYSAVGWEDEDEIEDFVGTIESLRQVPPELHRTEMWRLILADFASVPTSYLRLRLKPGQIKSIDAEHSDVYDEEYAKTHTIKVVLDKGAAGNGGYATGLPTPRIVETCTVTFQRDVPAKPQRYKLVAIHEIMHCLGVDHQKDDGDSVMSYHMKKYDLSAEDKAALTHLYPMKKGYGREIPTLGLACTPMK